MVNGDLEYDDDDVPRSGPRALEVPSSTSITATMYVDDGQQPGPSSTSRRPRPSIADLAGMLQNEKYVADQFYFDIFYLIFFLVNVECMWAWRLRRRWLLNLINFHTHLHYLHLQELLQSVQQKL
jgi:hypothetical protein